MVDGLGAGVGVAGGIGVWVGWGVPCAATVKACPTSGAALKVLLPACEARIMQVPAFNNVTVLPLTVHTSALKVLKLTFKPDDAVAKTVMGDSLRIRLGNGSKVMV